MDDLTQVSITLGEIIKWLFLAGAVVFIIGFFVVLAKNSHQEAKNLWGAKLDHLQNPGQGATEIKEMAAQLDITVRVNPQSGSIRFQVPDKTLILAPPLSMGTFLASAFHVLAGDRPVDYQSLVQQMVDILDDDERDIMLTAMKHSRHSYVGRALEKAMKTKTRQSVVA